MDSKNRSEWAKDFERISGKISSLAQELTDNKNVYEFINEMESKKKDLEIAIDSFKKVL